MKLTPIDPYSDIFADNHLLDVNGEYHSHTIKPHEFLYEGHVKGKYAFPCASNPCLYLLHNIASVLLFVYRDNLLILRILFRRPSFACLRLDSRWDLRRACSLGRWDHIHGGEGVKVFPFGPTPAALPFHNIPGHRDQPCEVPEKKEEYGR